MPTETQSTDQLAEAVKLLPAHFRENFEKAEAQLREAYGRSPGVPALVGLWLSCSTGSRIRTEFERAVLDIKRRGLTPNEQGDYDEDCL